MRTGYYHPNALEDGVLHMETTQIIKRLRTISHGEIVLRALDTTQSRAHLSEQLQLHLDQTMDALQQLMELELVESTKHDTLYARSKLGQEVAHALEGGKGAKEAKR
jgi:hypothetical protein